MAIPDAHSRVAVVTGASAGIGEATARTLADLGFHVVAVARRADRIERLAEEIGGTAVPTDITDDAAVAALTGRLRRVDVPVNNAGGARGCNRSPGPISTTGAGWGDQRAGHASGHPGAAAHADRIRRRPDRHGDLHRGDRGVRRRGWIHLGQARGGGAAPHTARRTDRKTGAAHRDCARFRPDRLLLLRFGGDVQRAEKVYAGSRR